MRSLIILMLVGIAFSSTNDGPVTVNTAGTVPFVVSFNSSGSAVVGDTDQDLTTGNVSFNDVDDDDYDHLGDGSDATLNYLDLGNIIVCDDFDSNHKFKINLQKSGWSLPDDYTTDGVDADRKNLNGTDTDQFYVKVTVDNNGFDDSEGIIPANSYGASFKGLDNQVTTVMTGGTNSHGVENGEFTIQGRILFDWIVDIPGVYGVDLTISVEQGD